MALVSRWAVASLALMVAASSGGESNWPQWRGPQGTGSAPDADPPVVWSEGANIRWKLPLPGLGHSSPVVWGDLVFVTTASPRGAPFEARYDNAPGVHDSVPVTQQYSFSALAVSRRDGRVVWERELETETPHEGGHYTGSLASSSPVTDGEHLFAFFGSRGLYALSLDGDLQWKADLGAMRTKHSHGEGSSPVLHGDALIVNWDHEGQSFVAAFDKATGKERWKVDRDEVSSWATPIVVEHAGKPQVIVNGTGRVRGYDLATGAVIWECGGLSANVVASPVAADGMVYAASSYDTRAMLAIRLAGAKGDITGTDQVAWTRSRATPYVPSLLLYEDSLYFLRHYQGVLSRVVASTGEEKSGPFRLGGLRDIYSSPVAAAGRIYITDRNGATLVLSHADKPELLALNRLDDSFSASAALVGRELFLRGERSLYCIAEEGSGSD